MTAGDRTNWRPAHIWRSTGYADNTGSYYRCSRCGVIGQRGGVFRSRLNKFGCTGLQASGPGTQPDSAATR